VTDDESGESMEPMEEVPLKELGETESGASRGIPDDADCVFRSYVAPLVLGGWTPLNA